MHEYYLICNSMLTVLLSSAIILDIANLAAHHADVTVMTREQALQRCAELCRQMNTVEPGSAEEQAILNELDTLEAEHGIDCEEIDA